MTPPVPQVLGEMAQQIAAVAQHGAQGGGFDAERISSLTLASMLIGLAAETWDGAADALVAENRALAALLDDAADETSFRLTALKAENGRLRARLIAAHAEAEAAGDVARQDAIWAELAASTERRMISVSPV